MAYGIGGAHKLEKLNIKRLNNTNKSFSAPSTPSYSYNKLNEYADISNEESLTAAIHFK